MAKKWNIKERRYEPYEIPDSWVCPMLTPNLDMPVNCASCGKAMRFGEGFTSHTIHGENGMGYSICEDCMKEEWAAEKAARQEKFG